MRTVKWNAFLSGLCGFAVILGVVAAGAHADVTIEKGSSILIFPKVRADGTFDTVIQLTNTGNSMVHAHCFYVNATLHSLATGLPCTVPSSTCVANWQETDFTIWLTKQQPTHWLVSGGRRIDLTDGFNQDGSGFDPGRVPPVGCALAPPGSACVPPPGCTGPGCLPQNAFEGELKCVEVTESEEPVTGNHLKGEATLKVVATTPGKDKNAPGTTKGDVSKYNAIGILGNPDATPGNPLLLDNNVYNACPAKLIVNHFGTGAADPVASPIPGQTTSFISTELTLVPCSEDFENQLPTVSTIQFLVFNEFEQRFSASTTVTCYLNVELTQFDSPTSPMRSVFSRMVLNTDVAQTEITPVPNLIDGSIHAVIGVAERISSLATAGPNARAAYNLHQEGDLIPETPDQILLSADQ